MVDLYLRHFVSSYSITSGAGCSCGSEFTTGSVYSAIRPHNTHSTSPIGVVHSHCPLHSMTETSLYLKNFFLTRDGKKFYDAGMRSGGDYEPCQRGGSPYPQGRWRVVLDTAARRPSSLSTWAFNCAQRRQSGLLFRVVRDNRCSSRLLDRSLGVGSSADAWWRCEESEELGKYLNGGDVKSWSAQVEADTKTDSKVREQSGWATAGP
jgi:hypothetical protein